MKTIKLQSRMSVKLVQHVGGDSSIVAAAKVSTEGAESAKHLAEEVTGGLIRYLMKQRHGSPFEHASMTFLVEAPIFVFREWHRHRIGWSYSETSGRYRELEPVFWVPDLLRKILPVENFRASRPEFIEGDELYHEALQNACGTAYQAAWDAYQMMLEVGVAREVARTVLPVGTYTSMYATCNPRSLMAFLSLRTHETDAKFVSYPQAEIEECARQMEHEFSKLFPITHDAFCEFGRVAP
jgi:thymidylate synthase (FAD)